MRAAVTIFAVVLLIRGVTVSIQLSASQHVNNDTSTIRQFDEMELWHRMSFMEDVLIWNLNFEKTNFSVSFQFCLVK